MLPLLISNNAADIASGVPERELVALDSAAGWRSRVAGLRLKVNAVEYVRDYWKHQEIPNFCPREFAQLSSL